jgi:hypothetical protein
MSALIMQYTTPDTRALSFCLANWPSNSPTQCPERDEGEIERTAGSNCTYQCMNTLGPSSDSEFSSWTDLESVVLFDLCDVLALRALSMKALLCGNHRMRFSSSTSSTGMWRCSKPRVRGLSSSNCQSMTDTICVTWQFWRALGRRRAMKLVASHHQ